MLRTLLAAVLAAPADPDLNPQAISFADGVSRHAALLIAARTFASGHEAPLGGLAPHGARGVSGGIAAVQLPGLKELDPYIFLDALIDVEPHILLVFCVYLAKL